MAVMWAYIYYDDGAVAKAAALLAERSKTICWVGRIMHVN